jgi:NADH-quinone oxidoreductase subunit C
VTAPEASGTQSRDVPPEGWLEAVAGALADGFDYFDWLSVVDTDDGRLTVVLHLWSLAGREHAFLRTTTEDGLVPSIAMLLPGAGWHEREAAEMFGLTFDGSPDPRPLLLPDGFDGHPLRKDFPLASRGLVDWPGTHEPTEHGPAARPPGRRRPTAVGVPDWPTAEGATNPQEHSDG